MVLFLFFLIRLWLVPYGIGEKKKEEWEGKGGETTGKGKRKREITLFTVFCSVEIEMEIISLMKDVENCSSLNKVIWNVSRRTLKLCNKGYKWRPRGKGHQMLYSTFPTERYGVSRLFTSKRSQFPDYGVEIRETRKSWPQTCKRNPKTPDYLTWKWSTAVMFPHSYKVVGNFPFSLASCLR